MRGGNEMMVLVPTGANRVVYIILQLEGWEGDCRPGLRSVGYDGPWRV